jgi:NO-binding membrane sensor protein with MHYT domain/nitrogen-specific signal transduction histidine kinase
VPGMYDPWTVVGSFLIASLAGYVAFETMDHTQLSDKPRQWATLGGITLGLGIWSTHFVGMMAWVPPFPLYYSVSKTILSVLIAISACVFAMHLVVHNRSRTKANSSITGAFLVGCGICAMHYVGMSALHFDKGTMWHTGWIIASLTIAIGASAAAIYLFQRSAGGTDSLSWRALASVTIALAICGMHYAGMAAFMPMDGAVSVHQPFSFTGPVLARVGVANTLIFTIILLIVSYRDKITLYQLASQARLEARDAERRLESLAAAGKIAASVAQEINNPLEAIINLLYLLEQGEVGRNERQYLSVAQAELKRITDITTHTLQFYDGLINPAEAFIPELFDSAVALFQTDIGTSGIEVETIWPEDLPTVLCREGEIRQVIANLVSNAIDAMPNGGRLQLAAYSDINGLNVSVTDTGRGIPSDVHTKVLDPFFTTKGMTGTGLGLSISSEIIQRHGGTFTFLSPAPHRTDGSEFRFFLPFTYYSN